MAEKTFRVILTLTHLDGGAFDGHCIKDWDWQAIVGGDDLDIAVSVDSVRRLPATPQSHTDRFDGIIDGTIR